MAGAGVMAALSAAVDYWRPVFAAIAFVSWAVAMVFFVGGHSRVWPYCKNLATNQYVPCVRCVFFLAGSVISIWLYFIFQPVMLIAQIIMGRFNWFLLLAAFILIYPTLYQGPRRRLGLQDPFPSTIALALFGFLAGFAVLPIFLFCNWLVEL